MKRIFPSQYIDALLKQKSLSDTEWLKRCDELAEQQPVLFFELTTFLRDGVREDLGRRLVDYLSILQFVAKDISESMSSPVSLPEFQAAVQRTMKFFDSITTDDTDDPAHFKRMIEARLKVVPANRNPMIWAGCFETLRSSEMKVQPLYPSICYTLASIAEAYAWRLQQEVL